MATIPAIRRAQIRFGVYRGTAFNDLSSYLASAQVTLGDVSTVGTGNTGGDGIAASARFTLRNDRPATDALHPGALASSYNQPDPLLSPYRTVLLEARMIPEGQTPGRWWPLFEGYLGDSIQVNQNAATVELAARDPAKLLMDTQLPGGITFGVDGGQRLDAVINAMLISTLGSRAPTLRVIGTPDLYVDPYQPENLSVWHAAQQLVTQAGWYLGWRRNTAGRFELTLMDPPREKSTPDWALTAEDIYTADVNRSDRDVRNGVIVWYTDPETRERTRWPASAPLTDSTSIASLGGVMKLGVIEVTSTSQIDTPGEAEALARRFLHDLSAPIEGVNVNLPLLPEVQLFDMVSTTVPAIGNTQLFAVNSLQHQIEIGREGQRSSFRTVIAGNSRVIGRKRSWLALEPVPGSPGDPEGPHQSRLLPPVLTVQAAEPGFSVLVEPGPASGVQVAGVEIHWSTTNGFTPSGTEVGVGTCKARGPESRFTFSEVDPETPYYVRARAYSTSGELGPFTGQFTVVAGRVTHILLDANTTVAGDFRVTESAVIGLTDELDALFEGLGDFEDELGNKLSPADVIAAINNAPSGQRVNGIRLIVNGNSIFNGDIDVLRAGTGRTGTLRFWQGNELMLAIGAVGELFGAPANAVGIAGALGVSVWFQGASRHIDSGTVANIQIQALGGPFAVGNTVYPQGGGGALILSGPFTVPAGKVWDIGLTLSRLQHDPNIQGAAAITGWRTRLMYHGVQRVSPVIPAGTWNHIGVIVNADLRFLAPVAASVANFWADINWTITERDA